MSGTLSSDKGKEREKRSRSPSPPLSPIERQSAKKKRFFTASSSSQPSSSRTQLPSSSSSSHANTSASSSHSTSLHSSSAGPSTLSSSSKEQSSKAVAGGSSKASTSNDNSNRLGWLGSLAFKAAKGLTDRVTEAAGRFVALPSRLGSDHDAISDVHADSALAVGEDDEQESLDNTDGCTKSSKRLRATWSDELTKKVKSKLEEEIREHFQEIKEGKSKPLVERVAHLDGDTTRGIGSPKCYRKGDMWIRAPSLALSWLRGSKGLEPLDPFPAYAPDWFIWLPECLVDYLPCPSCKGHLYRIGLTSDSRRFYTLTGSAYMMSSRLKCSNAKSTSPEEEHRRIQKYGLESCKHSTRQGWDQELLSSLPAHVTVDFPASFTWRSGLEKTLLQVFEHCSLKGMGPTPLSNMMLSLSTHLHDSRHLAYLSAVISSARVKSDSSKEGKIGSMLSSDSEPPSLQAPNFSLHGDMSGFAGSAPSPDWIAAQINKVVSLREWAMNQARSLIGGRILAMDHSFKVIKKCLSVAGQHIFGACHTVTTETGELRSLSYMATKGHACLEPVLRGIEKSFSKYGLPKPECLYTDDPATDEGLVTRIFTSLQRRFGPGSQEHSLPELTLPQFETYEDGAPSLLSGSRIDLVLSEKIQEYEKQAEDLGHPVHLGFDMEWPVAPPSSTSGGVLQTAVIQIAWPDREVSLVRVYQEKELPVSIQTLLLNDSFRLVGVNIKSDIQKLIQDFKLKTDLHNYFNNIQDLVLLAKSFEKVPKGKGYSSLQKLSEAILLQTLPKPQHIRVSLVWSSHQLPSEYRLYAALDALVARLIWEKIGVRVPRRPVPWEEGKSLTGTQVELLSADKVKVIAVGQILPINFEKESLSRSEKTFKMGKYRTTLSPTRALISVQQVIIDSRLMCYSDSERNMNVIGENPINISKDRGLFLREFGEPAFQVVVKLSDLCLPPIYCDTSYNPYSSIDTSTPLDAAAGTSTTDSLGPSSASEADELNLLNFQSLSAEDLEVEKALDQVEDQDQLEFEQSESHSNSLHDIQESGLFPEQGDLPGSEELTKKVKEALCPTSRLSASLSPEDQEAASKLDQTIDEIINSSESLVSGGLEVDQCRVLKDPWHLMDMLRLSKSHSGYRLFMKALSKALFDINKKDFEAFDEAMKRANKGGALAVISSRPAFSWKYIRRTIPLPSVLLPRIGAVLKAFGKVGDLKTGKPLFGKYQHNLIRQLLNTIKKGYASDIPGVVLYRSQGTDSYGLTRWSCMRGTNIAEGSIHSQISSHSRWSNVGPEFAAGMLLLFLTSHNLKVNALVRTGRPWARHNDLDLLNKLSLYLIEAESSLAPSTVDHLPGYQNGLLYEDSEEVSTVVPLPDNMRDLLQMQPWEMSESSTRSYRWLSHRQGTRFAVVPVSSDEEMQLFTKLAAGSTCTDRKGSLDFMKMAQIWSSHADGKKIHYKLPEHLSHWFDLKTKSQQASLTSGIYPDLKKFNKFHKIQVSDPENDWRASLPTKGRLEAEINRLPSMVGRSTSVSSGPSTTSISAPIPSGIGTSGDGQPPSTIAETSASALPFSTNPSTSVEAASTSTSQVSLETHSRSNSASNDQTPVQATTSASTSTQTAGLSRTHLTESLTKTKSCKNCQELGAHSLAQFCKGKTKRTGCDQAESFFTDSRGSFERQKGGKDGKVRIYFSWEQRKQNARILYVRASRQTLGGRSRVLDKLESYAAKGNYSLNFDEA